MADYLVPEDFSYYGEKRGKKVATTINDNALARVKLQLIKYRVRQDDMPRLLNIVNNTFFLITKNTTIIAAALHHRYENGILNGNTVINRNEFTKDNMNEYSLIVFEKVHFTKKSKEIKAGTEEEDEEVRKKKEKIEKVMRDKAAIKMYVSMLEYENVIVELYKTKVERLGEDLRK